MPDDLSKKRPQDANKINLSQQWEIEYWTETLNTTEAMLRIAIAKVGTLVSDVKDFLKKH